MQAAARRQRERVWTIPVPAHRTHGAARHVHQVQIAGIEQRVRHKKSMVSWLELLTTLSTVGAFFGFTTCAAGLGAVIMSLRAQEPALVGLLVFALALVFALCCVLARFLVGNAKRALCKEIFESVAERNRLQYVR